MAGLRGNVAWVAWGKQSVKGTPVATYPHRAPFSGGNIQPDREVDNLAETDSSRDQGVSFIRKLGASGAPEVYVRDANIHTLLEAALGGKATSGSTNYTHTLTPANALPYVTIARGIGDTLWEQFVDNKVNDLSIQADTGGPLTAAFDVIGRSANRQTSEPASLPAIANGAVYSFNEAAVTLGGSATALVNSFELTVSNNVSDQQTDDVVPYDVVEGQREVTLGFQIVFETLDEYNKFHYGGAAGTTQSGALFATSAVFTFTKGVNNEISFTLPSIAYEEFPVEPDPGGAPITVDVRARAQRGGAPVLTAVVKNQTAI